MKATMVTDPLYQRQSAWNVRIWADESEFDPLYAIFAPERGIKISSYAALYG